MAIKLVIADDHPLILRALEGLFAECDDIDTLACCATGAETIEAVRRHRPDVLLLDLKMSGLTGLDVIRRLNEGGDSCRTIILTAAACDEDVAAALEMGVAGLILKDSTPDAVVESVRQVSEGQTRFDHDTLTRALAAARQSREAGVGPQSTLTPRELELIKLVAEGLRNKVIAERLAITEGTVKIHLHNIYDKLGVDGRLELVLAAQQKKLV